ncbi:hypothetical protein QFZ76_008431 [Streptomyces sp. V4I2]|nr:hypothetical protein [Streptomyces sp. V4I2]
MTRWTRRPMRYAANSFAWDEHAPALLRPYGDVIPAVREVQHRG